MRSRSRGLQERRPRSPAGARDAARPLGASSRVIPDPWHHLGLAGRRWWPNIAAAYGQKTASLSREHMPVVSVQAHRGAQGLSRFSWCEGGERVAGPEGVAVGASIGPRQAIGINLTQRTIGQRHLRVSWPIIGAGRCRRVCVFATRERWANHRPSTCSSKDACPTKATQSVT